jgi:hypothetical protein
MYTVSISIYDRQDNYFGKDSVGITVENEVITILSKDSQDLRLAKGVAIIEINNLLVRGYLINIKDLDNSFPAFKMLTGVKELNKKIKS